MSRIQTTAHYNELLKGVDPKFFEVYNQAAEGWTPQMIGRLIKKESTDKAIERTKTVGGAGFLKKKEENSAVNRGTQVIGYKTEYNFDEYDLGVEVSRKAMDDMDYRDKLDEFTALSRGAYLTMDKAAAQIFNSAFSTAASYNGYAISRMNDTKALCSTLHPSAGGFAAQSNASATGEILGPTSVAAARTAMFNMRYDDNTPVTITDRFALVVPPALEEVATQLAETDRVPTSSDNAVNFFKGRIMDVYSSQWLSAAHGGSDTAWFMIVPNETKLMFFDRVAPQFDAETVPETKARLYSVYARFGVGYSDWRKVYGSKGDGASYSS
jgi:hypothetical protein